MGGAREPQHCPPCSVAYEVGTDVGTDIINRTERDNWGNRGREEFVSEQPQPIHGAVRSMAWDTCREKTQPYLIGVFKIQPRKGHERKQHAKQQTQNRRKQYGASPLEIYAFVARVIYPTHKTPKPDVCVGTATRKQDAKVCTLGHPSYSGVFVKIARPLEYCRNPTQLNTTQPPPPPPTAPSCKSPRVSHKIANQTTQATYKTRAPASVG